MSKDFHQNFMFTNTEICVDLKLVTRKPGATRMGTNLNGSLTHDDDYHYTFIECASERKDVKRNPLVYEGRRINVHLKDDGTPYPTFNRPQFTECFTFNDFCIEAAQELIFIASLLGEESESK